MGLFCFVGINEFGEEIVEFIEPELQLDIFYYSCSNKFVMDIATKYIGLNDINGTLIFASGDECLGYQHKQGKFIKIFGLNGNLVKRHNKGGYSANRFARLAEESRHAYVVRICDRIRELNLNQNEDQSNQNNQNNNRIWIFGSEEIVQMVIAQCPIKLLHGGFLNFNSSTILNSKYWIEFLLNKSKTNLYDNYYKEIIDLLATNPDMLDFDPDNKDTMKYYIEKEKTITHNQINQINLNKTKTNKLTEQNKIPLIQSSKYYSQLVLFEYVGVKFYNYQINDDIF